MARPGGPYWWTARSRWAANIQGSKLTAPREIGPKERAAAWTWYEAEVKRIEEGLAAVSRGPSVADLFDAYLGDCQERVAVGTMDSVTLDVTTRLLTTACGFRACGAKFGDLLADQAREQDLRSVAEQWLRRGAPNGRGPASTSYVGTAVRRVKTAWRWAKRTGLIRSFPFEDYSGPKVVEPEVEIPPVKTVADWLRYLRSTATSPERRNYLLLQRLIAATGARPSEIATATWGEVAWSVGKTPSGASYGLLVRRKWKNSGKTGKARRIVLGPALLRPLRRLFDRVQPEPGDLIFTSLGGRPWTSNRLVCSGKDLRRAAIAAGWRIPAEGVGRLRAYQLRHLAATRLIERGVESATAAEMLGTSVAMLSRTYLHLSTDHLAAAAEAARGARVQRLKVNSRRGTDGRAE
ncbi:tyrosine-type recombinase/integrase [Paludisphaera rhizosphaerae]|uniref:tyrosine-type recombinase/integrase n=1 Tax=Paludisphaera rhizosphaerae TaxID=2711216 RepID=UPI0013ED2767|nr:tyrosine-type recombinase/integrase [Paludisphaera rhizosphaerae]